MLALAVYGAHALPALQPPLRPYQQYFVDLCRRNAHNYIVALPTGAGKTLIAIEWAREAARRHPRKCIVFVVPTVPLLTQQAEVFRNAGMDVELCHGGRRTNWGQAIAQHCVIFCTPQKLVMALQSGETSFDFISLLMFDECHHAVKRHPYNEICKLYAHTLSKPRILGLSASPSAGATLAEAMKNLTIMCRTYQAHIASASTQPELAESLSSFVNRPEILYADSQQIDGPVKTFVEEIATKAASLLRAAVGVRLVDSTGAPLCGPECEYAADAERVRDSEYLAALNAAVNGSPEHADVMSAVLLLSSIESLEFFGALPEDSHREATIAAMLKHIKDADLKLALCESHAKVADNPKLQVLRGLLQSQGHETERTAIVFVKTREMCSQIAMKLEQWAGQDASLHWIRPHVFLGHNNRESEHRMTMSQQREVIDRFRHGNINVLVSTSVAEEGIDVPSVGLVVRLDHQMTTINLVQSRGRARAQCSKYFVVCEPWERRFAQAAVLGEKHMNEAIHALSVNPPAGVSYAANTWTDEDRTEASLGRLLLQRRGLQLAHAAHATVEIEEDWKELLEDACQSLGARGPVYKMVEREIGFQSLNGEALILSIHNASVTVTLSSRQITTDSDLKFSAADAERDAACKMLSKLSTEMQRVFDTEAVDEGDQMLMNSLSSAALAAEVVHAGPAIVDAKSALNVFGMRTFREGHAGNLAVYYSAKFGEDHCPQFVGAVCIMGHLFVGNVCSTKKEAEQSAAREALRRLQQP